MSEAKNGAALTGMVQPLVRCKFNGRFVECKLIETKKRCLIVKHNESLHVVVKIGDDWMKMTPLNKTPNELK